MTPFVAPPDYSNWSDVADLIHRSFAYMEPLLGHPARATSVWAEQLAEASSVGTAYLVEQHGIPVACLFTRPSRDFQDALYLGWLAVDERYRGKELAKVLIATAETEARSKGYAAMTLDTGRAITELHTVFRSLGCEEVPGTGDIITFRKPLE